MTEVSSLSSSIASERDDRGTLLVDHQPAHGSRRATALVWILVLGAAVRLLGWSCYRNEPLSIWDERDYDALATNLIVHGEFTFTPGGTPTSLRPPLYPVFVAAIYSVTGVGNVAAVRLMQAMVSLLTVVAVYVLAHEITTPRTAIIATAMTSFYPSLVFYSNLLLAETLFTFFLTLTCLAFASGLKINSIALMGVAGALLGLAALTRSAVWLAPPFLAGFILLTWHDRWPRRIAAALALVAAFAATIAPWSIRNTRLQETFVAIDVMGGRNFMMGNYAHTPLYRSWDAIALEGEQSWAHEVWTTYPPEARRTQGYVDKLAFRQGLAFVQAHPVLTIQRSIVKFFDFWALERELIAGVGRGHYGSFSKMGWIGLAILFAGSYAVAILSAVFGMVFTPPNDRRIHWFFLCVITFLCAVHTVVFGHSRYHLPLMPIILIYSAGTFGHWREIWQQRSSIKFAIAAGICALLIGSWMWSAIVVDWPRIQAAWNNVG